MAAPVDRPEAGALATLNARSREIFRNIVDSYLSTGEPVGSRHLSRMLPITLSPASVRNVMQDLEELGLIYAPHASAGRLPTQQGLRLFVDALLEFGDLGREERARIDNQVRAAAEDGGFEGALAETTSLLSELTRGAGVVLTTKTNARLKHVEFVRLESDQALAILVAEDGSIENRVVGTPPGMPASTFLEASNFLNARIRGRTLSEVTGEIEAARQKRAPGTRRNRHPPRRSWSRLMVRRREDRATSSSFAAKPICSATCTPPRTSSEFARYSPTSRPRPT